MAAMMTDGRTAAAMLLEALPTDDWLEPDLAVPAERMYGVGRDVGALDALVREGRATSMVRHRCARCPVCRCHQCIIDERCARCESANLVTVSLYHHIPCAGIFPAPDGIEAVGECPKCHDSLARDPQASEPVGETYRCIDCNAESPEPALQLLCLQCHKAHDLQDVQFHRLWQYRRVDGDG